MNPWLILALASIALDVLAAAAVLVVVFRQLHAEHPGHRPSLAEYNDALWLTVRVAFHFRLWLNPERLEAFFEAYRAGWLPTLQDRMRFLLNGKLPREEES